MLKTSDHTALACCHFIYTGLLLLIHLLFLLSNVQYAQVLEMMGEVIKSKQEFLPLEISVS